jgi:hypothetical protein
MTTLHPGSSAAWLRFVLFLILLTLGELNLLSHQPRAGTCDGDVFLSITVPLYAASCSTSDFRNSILELTVKMAGVIDVGVHRLGRSSALDDMAFRH